MTQLEKLQSAIAQELNELNSEIRASLCSNNELMNTVIENYLKSKGKMIRPILVILSGRLFGHTNKNVISAAAAVEMLHNASLIHDDVVDESKMRRDRPTINAVWDNHIAVLVGDFFVSSALHRAISTGDIRIISSIAKLGKMLSLGEIDQIYNARYHNLDEEAYFGVISRKTASLFVSCVEMGAYAVGVDNDQEIAPLRRYAEFLGQCFQIRDDVFDYFADSSIGKPTGNDLREGKITLPLLHVLNCKDLQDNEAMTALAFKEDLTPAEIATLISYTHSNGGIEYAYEVMERLREKAFRILDESYQESEATHFFRSIFDYIISRSY